MALQDGYILIPRTQRKRDYAFRIKDPEMGTLSKIIQVDPPIHPPVSSQEM